MMRRIEELQRTDITSESKGVAVAGRARLGGDGGKQIYVGGRRIKDDKAKEGESKWQDIER
jgi:hypothetical protein